MNTYLIFHYRVDGHEYVEAYPTRNVDAYWFLLGHALTSDAQPPLVTDFAWVSSPSRNQARRAGHTNWVRDVSFNDMVYRVYTRKVDLTTKP